MHDDRAAMGIFRTFVIIVMIVCASYILLTGICNASVPGAYITGYALDEYGKPVPFTNVSLWQNDKLWQQTNYLLNNCQNPQMSNIAYSSDYGFSGEGGFLFGFLYPGDYVLKVEKDGYTGTMNVSVDASTISSVGPPKEHAIPVNITLEGYRVPGLTAEQLAYNGTIAGNIRTAWGFKTTGVNISLWLDGRLVNRFDNPQATFPRKYLGVEVDYIFEHLPPGNYTVTANYSAGGDYSDSATVNVGEKAMRVDIVLSRALNRPTDFPVNSFTPMIGEFSSSSNPQPTPTMPLLIGLFILGAVAYCIIKKK